MSLAWYIKLERPIPGFDHGVNGKPIAHAGKMLDAIAEQSGVPPLMHFFSASPEELAQFTGDDSFVATKKLPSERWFSAAEGLTTVHALIQGVQNTSSEHADRILDDLQQFQNVLEVAVTNAVRWHLAVDF